MQTPAIIAGDDVANLLNEVDEPYKTAERAGLGRVTSHQFHHIHSSLLNDLRVPVKIAHEQLGHASIQTTLNIHTHVGDASHRGDGIARSAVVTNCFPSLRKRQRAGIRKC